MTLKELQTIEEIISWAKGKYMSQYLWDKLKDADQVIKREIQMRVMDPRKEE